MVFFSSTALGSLILGLGPGFLRGRPAAVSLGVDVVDVGAGAGGVWFAFATPTCEESGVATRMVELFGVPCSGEWGGELKLPGELATSMASMLGGEKGKRNRGIKYTARYSNTPGNFGQEKSNNNKKHADEEVGPANDSQQQEQSAVCSRKQSRAEQQIAKVGQIIRAER